MAIGIWLGIVATGVLLVARIGPLTPLHYVKIAASLVAVASNLICAVWVIQRRRIEDAQVPLACRRKIWATAAVGVAFGTTALVIGLLYFRG